MNKFFSLKYRLLISYILLSIVICMVFFTILNFSEDFIEEELIYPQLNFELNRFIQGENNTSVLVPPGLIFYNEASLPEALKYLKPRHSIQDVQLSGTEMIAVVSGTDNNRFIVIDEHSTFERIESTISIIFLLASFFAILIAWFFSQIAIRAVIAPLSLLANEVKTDVENLNFGIESDDEIGLLARAIEERNARLHDFLERERVFSSDVSHELRTPLTVILGASEVLSVKLSAQPELLETVNRIKRTAIDTTEQVSALLMLSRSPDELAVSLIQIHTFAEEQLTLCEPLLIYKPVVFKLSIQEEVNLSAPPVLVAILLRNLLRNACQHTEEGTISIILFKNRMVIEDTGSGIDVDSQELLFQRISTRSQSGYGFGLSIVRRIADHLRWSVCFEPTAEGGSRFIVYFADAERVISQGSCTK